MIALTTRIGLFLVAMLVFGIGPGTRDAHAQHVNDMPAVHDLPAAAFPGATAGWSTKKRELPGLVDSDKVLVMAVVAGAATVALIAMLATNKKKEKEKEKEKKEQKAETRASQIMVIPRPEPLLTLRAAPSKQGVTVGLSFNF